jgi:hypothetical protein
MEYFRYLTIAVGIILKSLFDKYGVNMWTELSWLRTGSKAGRFEDCNETAFYENG